MIDIKKDIVGKKPHWMKDSDRDGVINPIDCEPYNKNKQGVMHRLAASVADKFGNEKKAEEFRERGVIVDEARREARIEGARERAKYIKEEAVYKEKKRYEHRKKYIDEGGFGGQLGRGLSGLGKGVKSVSNYAQPKPTYTTKRVKVKTGKGKKAKYKTVTRKVKTQPKTQSDTKPQQYDFRNVGRMF